MLAGLVSEASFTRLIGEASLIHLIGEASRRAGAGTTGTRYEGKFFVWSEYGLDC